MNLQDLTDLWSRIIASPAYVIICLFLNGVAFVWEMVKVLDNRWIPVVLSFGGSILYLLLGPAVVNPHPLVLKAMLGFILGLLSWAMHGGLSKVLRKVFPGFLPDNNSNPNTKP